jgi:signal transduction histidine kinase
MNTSLGQQIVVMKVWDKTGRVVYSTIPDAIGQTFPIEPRLQQSLDGEVTTRISSLDDDENVPERDIWPRLLEIYMPVRLRGTDQIIAAAEFYQLPDDLEKEIEAAQFRSWLVVGGIMLVMFMLLAVFAKWTSDTIYRQRQAMNTQVVQLTHLLEQNDELSERVRQAAASVTTLNENILRRISAELHDGPAQDMSLAALNLGGVIAKIATSPPVSADRENAVLKPLKNVDDHLQHALNDIRAIAGGYGLPHLQELTIAETATRAVRAHERRTGTKAELHLEGPLDEGTLPLKITLFRLIQESLNNAHRHANGQGQQVHVKSDGDFLDVEISDEGAGFNVKQAFVKDDHMGLVGMQERVESLGGEFLVKSTPGQGTRVLVRLAIRGAEGKIYDR